MKHFLMKNTFDDRFCEKYRIPYTPKKMLHVREIKIKNVHFFT